MKKFLALALAVLFLFLTGCSAGTAETMEESFAVEEELLELYGNNQESVMEAYGLSEDKMDDINPYYLGKAVWCGVERETKFSFWDGSCDAIMCGYSLDNNDDARGEVESTLKAYIQQFGNPKKYKSEFNFVEGEYQDFSSDELESLLDAFWSAEEEAYLCFNFAWESDEDDGPEYVECIFYRKEDTNPDLVYIVHYLMKAFFAPTGEETDLNILI